MSAILLSLLLLQSAGSAPATSPQRDQAGPATTIVIRHPDRAGDDRVVFEADGDLYLAHLRNDDARPALQNAVRLTDTTAWDREPVWNANGSTVVFVSDRSGIDQLWEIAVGADSAIAPAERLTELDDPAREPVVLPGGDLVFVRGDNVDADLWRLTLDGHLTRLTHADGAERSPTVSPDGRALAWVHVLNGRRRLMVRAVDGDRARAIRTGQPIEEPRWEPAGERIAYTTRGTTPGIWITPRDGRYANLVAEVAATPMWSPDGTWILAAELPAPEPGYNGDPARLASRNTHQFSERDLALKRVLVPPPLADAARSVAVSVPIDRTERNRRRFDAVADRIERLYFADNPQRRVWRALRERLRPRALRAADAAALEAVIFELLSERPTLRPEATGRAGVSSANPHATAAGIEILKRGGNVVDAAVAVSFALGVVEPDASGVGGYGEMVVYRRDMDKPVVIEFLTRVPEHASLTNGALLENGRLPTDGPVLANVPGTVAGMYMAWERYGSGNVAWADLVEPAIRLAEDGFVADDAFPTTLHREAHRFLKYPSSEARFFPDGHPVQPGDHYTNPDLAWTLRHIAADGADGFYRGPVAQRMVRDLHGQGNAITRLDLARYHAVERPAVQGMYRGNTVYSAAPAVSGGAALVSKLHLLDHAAASGSYVTSAPMLHAMLEAWKLQPSSRGLLADPDIWPVNLDPIVNPDSARARWRDCFDPDRASGPDELRTRRGRPACAARHLSFQWGEDHVLCDPGTCRRSGTTAFTVVDADGNMVAVTQTLGTWGGNFYVTPGLGFLYNDKLRSYGTDPDRYNARVPFARNVTSIAPTLVFHGTGAARRPWLAVGAAGNAWITSAVYQVISGIVDGGLGPQRALELPRFLVGVRRDPSDRAAVRDIVIQMEDGLAPDVRRRLEAMGHRFTFVSLRGELREGYGAAAMIDGNTVRVGADPRRSGTAAAIR